MQLIELSQSDKYHYNRFVANQPSGSFLQSWDWGQWQESLGRKVFRFFIKDGNSNVIASVQLIRMPLPGKKCYLYAPYGPVLAKSENPQFTIFNFQTLARELEKKFLEAVFIRVEPKVQIPELQSAAKKSLHIQPISTLVIDLSKSTGQLMAEMHSKTRYNIKLAQKHGVEVLSELAIVPGYGLYWKESLDLIIETSKRQDFKTFAPGYYQKLLDFFACAKNSDVKIFMYRALYQKQLLAAAVMVDFPAKGGSASGGGTRTYLFGGSSSEHREVMAPHLLHFKAIEDAKALGLSNYDFWGLETTKEKNPGFARFKLGFGGGRLEYPGAFDAVCKPGQYKLYRAIRKLNQWKNRIS